MRSLVVCTCAAICFSFFQTPALAEDDLSIASSTDGRVEAFFLALEPSGGVYHAWQLSHNADQPSVLGSWSAWEKFGPTPDANSQIVSTRDPSGKLFVAWVSQGAIWFAGQHSANSGFDPPVKIGTQDLHGLTLAMNRDGRIEMFALSSGGAAWSVYETAPGSRNWASKLIGGHDLQQLAPASYFDGRLGLAALGADRHVYFTAQYAPGGDWYNWTGLQGHDIQSIAAAANADGRLNVAAIGGDGAFYELSQNQVGEQSVGGWSDWRYRASGPFIGPIKLSRNADGRLEASMRTADKGLVHIWQKTPNGSWSDEVASYYPGVQQGFDVAPLTDGRLALVSFHSYLPASSGMHAETAFAVTSQDHVNSFWRISVPPPPTLFQKPASVAITEFKAHPDYVNQGDYSSLQWTLATSGGCTPVDLDLFERVYGQPETKILEESSPGLSGSKSVTPPPISSPVYYRLSVACKGVGGSAVSKETTLGFAPKPIMAPYIVAYGPFVVPSPPHEKMPFTISWTFENLGNADSSEAQVDLYIDGVKEGDTKTVSQLGTGKVTTVSWSVTKELTGYAHTAEIRSGTSSLGSGNFTMDP